MEHKSRLFIALVLPYEVKQHLRAGCTKLKRKWNFSRWVHPDDYHITLHFLGDVEEKKKEHILNALHTCSAKAGSFPLNLSGLGIFGREKQPRVLWAGVSGDLTSLHVLQKQVTQTIAPLGFPSEKRVYRPHITLARKCRRQEFILASEANSFFQETGWKADEIALYETRPGHQPMYKPARKFILSGPNY